MYLAPAKINLGLWVGPRDGNGYHPVDTVMHTVAWGDRLFISPSDHMLWESSPELPVDEENLMVRAYAWAKRRAPDLTSIHARLEKRTPVGAGLGGGSADAAAMVRWALQEAQEVLAPELVHLDVLGQDVPFLVQGGVARARGYGADLTFAPALTGSIVLVNPGFGLSTVKVYQAYDEMEPKPLGAGADATWHAILAGEMPPSEEITNELESAAFKVEPGLKDFRAWVEAVASPMGCHMSGSGATYFIIGSDPSWADWLCCEFKKRGAPWAVATDFQGPLRTREKA